MDEHLELAVRPFPNSGKLEKFWKTCSCCCNPFGVHSSVWVTTKEKRMIGQLKLCRMRLPNRQRQLDRFLAAPGPQIGNAYGSYSVSATIRPPETRKTAITRERLCWDDHVGKSEREGTFQREYSLFSRTRCAPESTDIYSGGL